MFLLSKIVESKNAKKDSNVLMLFKQYDQQERKIAKLSKIKKI